MRIPGQFQLKGKTWLVVFRKRVKHEDGEICAGLCEFDKRRILIAKDLPEDKIIATFLHELVHATLFEAHLQENTGLAIQAEEIVCDAIADMLGNCFELRWKSRKGSSSNRR